MSKQLGQGRNWYAVHTYSGYEDAVGRNLRQRVESLDMGDKIFNVLVPTEKKIKVKAGKRVEVEEKIYQGYVLVDMIVTEDSWYLIRNTPRVTGFVGSGNQPVPVSQAEIDHIMSRMANSTTVHTTDLMAGEIVKVTEGPFKDYEGKIAEVDSEKGKLKVLITIFGRETPYELDFLQVKKL